MTRRPSGAVLQVELEDKGTAVLASEEAAPFADVQVGGNRMEFFSEQCQADTVAERIRQRRRE